MTDAAFGARPFTVGAVSYHAQNPLLIAELGTSHGGDWGKARELVDAAAEAGAACVKVQIVYADEILHPKTGAVFLTGREFQLYDVFKRLEVEPAFYARLMEYARAKGLLFLATPFGPKSAAELRALRPDFVKVASPELNYMALTGELASWGIPVVLSSGVATLGDIEAALSGFRREAVCLLHCVTAYPAPEEAYNLALLPLLSGIFGVAAGVSDHSLDPLLVPLLALSCGAAVIEKHFCLAHDGGGLDDPIALTPADFLRMSRALSGAKEKASAEIVREVEGLFGRERLRAVLGDGVKRLAEAERGNYERTNRSLHAVRAIEKGELFTAENVAALRTEKVLRPGLGPSWYAAVLGRRARAAIAEGEGIRFQDV